MPPKWGMTKVMLGNRDGSFLAMRCRAIAESSRLEGGPYRCAKAIVRDHRRADAVATGMVEDDTVTAVHLLVDRQELVLGHRPVEDGDMHVDADHPQLVQAAP
jgi:hypothetical protein